ncbi:hypothetical protein GCM10022197_24140 [Microlunatus spumicola]|uniref:Signal peptidase I n=1 Tax=Microlunatus spumicola TaxID=81499 RepID=A0ABP6XHK2_9ACTN
MPATVETPVDAPALPGGEHPRQPVRELALTLGALAGVLCLLVTIAASAWQLTPLVFRSGSMGPDIPVGSLGVARRVPAGAVVPGDVVSVDDAAGARVTHRVVQVTPAGGDGPTLLRLRGDANPVEDAQPYPVREVDRLLWSAPRLGYAVAWLSSRPATFLGGLLVGVAVAWAFGLRPPTGARRARRDGPGAGTTGGAPRRALLVRRSTAAVAGAVVLSTSVGVDSASAAFTDTAPATSGTFTAYQVPTPPTLGCSTGLGTITFSWAAQTGPLTLNLAVSGRTSNVALAAGQTSYTLTSSLLGTGGGTATLQRSEAFTSTTWTALGNTRNITMVLGLLTSCS